MPGAHKIGAAISGPRITGGNFMDTTLFLKQGKHENMATSGCLRVSRMLVNKASGDSALQVLGNKERKKLPNFPVLPIDQVYGITFGRFRFLSQVAQSEAPIRSREPVHQQQRGPEYQG